MIYIYDALWIFLFVLAGFLFHSTLNYESVSRFLITYVCVLIFWLIPAEISGLRKNVFNPKGILLSSLIAIPWSITLRAYILQRVVLPIFVFVMFIFFVISAFALRWIYLKVFK